MNSSRGKHRQLSTCAVCGGVGAHDAFMLEELLPVCLLLASNTGDGALECRLYRTRCSEPFCKAMALVLPQQCRICSPMQRLAGYTRHITPGLGPENNGSMSGPTTLFRPRKDAEPEPPKKERKYGDWKR
jgi:hypothetical protein